MHIARCTMEKTTRTGWSLRRLRERVLRAGARMVISGRRMTLALSSAAASIWDVERQPSWPADKMVDALHWEVLWPQLTALHWADP